MYTVERSMERGYYFDYLFEFVNIYSYYDLNKTITYLKIKDLQSTPS